MKQQNAQEEFGAFIDIDWANQTHFVSLVDVKTQQEQRYKLEQRPEVLLQWVNELQQRFPGQRVAVALEQSRGALIYALMSYGFFVLFPVNPKALARYRAAFNVGGAKDDPTDSDLLLELVTLHRSKLRAWRPDDELTRSTKGSQSCLRNTMTMNCSAVFLAPARRWHHGYFQSLALIAIALSR